MRSKGVERGLRRPRNAESERPARTILAKLYVDDAASLADLARQFAVTTDAVKTWLSEDGIVLRPRGYGPAHDRRHPRPSEEELRTWWVDERRSAKDIAERCGVTGSAVYRWLRAYGISRPRKPFAPRPDDQTLAQLRDIDRLSVREVAERYNVSTVSARVWFDEAGIAIGFIPRPSGSTLRAMYLDERLTIAEMAKRLRVRVTRVQRWLRDEHIPTRRSGTSSSERPSPMQLRVWYVREHRSTAQIATRCGVTVGTIQRWLGDAGVTLRRPGRSLQRRGLRAPTEAELRRLVWEDHLPYRQIAGMFGCGATAIGQWLIKYQIPRPTNWETARGGQPVDLPTANELSERYESGDSLKTIAEDYPVSWQTIATLARSYGIELRRPGWYDGPPLICDDGHVVRSSYELRVDNWLTAHGLDHEVEPRVPFHRHWRADFRVRDTYIEVWGVTGWPSYDQKKQAKVAAFAAHQIDLLQLPHSIFSARSGAAFERALSRLIPVLKAPKQRDVGPATTSDVDEPRIRVPSRAQR